MEETEARTIRENVLAWAEVTDLCLCLRRAVLRAALPDKEVEQRLFAEIREHKEAQWHMSPS